VNLRIDQGVKGDKRGAGGAAEVIEIGAGHGKIRRYLGGHPLELIIKGDRTAHHVIEHLRSLSVKDKVAGALDWLSKDMVRGATGDLGMSHRASRLRGQGIRFDGVL
jgi:hypothetical protein